MIDEREHELLKGWYMGNACVCGAGVAFVTALLVGGDWTAPWPSVFKAIAAAILGIFPSCLIAAFIWAKVEDRLGQHRAEQQPKEDQRIQDALDFFRRHGVVLVDSPEKERVFAPLADAGYARKEGNTYVNTGAEHLAERWDAYYADRQGKAGPPGSAGYPS